MLEFKYTIKNSNGMHARPAGVLVKEATKFECDITINAKGKTADAKKIFSLMTLGVKYDDDITVIFNGKDEKEAYSHLESHFKNNL